MPPQKDPKNTKKEFSWARVSKTISFWMLIVLIPVVLIQMSGARQEAARKLDYSRFRAELVRDNVKSVTVQGGRGHYSQSIQSGYNNFLRVDQYGTRLKERQLALDRLREVEPLPDWARPKRKDRRGEPNVRPSLFEVAQAHAQVGRGQVDVWPLARVFAHPVHDRVLGTQGGKLRVA